MHGTRPSRAPLELLVSRNQELEQLARRLDQVRRGRGSIMVVSGEAGVGKTALVNQLRNGALTLSGNCYENANNPPYGPWVEVLHELRRHNQRLAADHQTLPLGPDDAVQDQREISDRILRELAEAAQSQPVVVILEDMHWADNATIDVLRMLSRQVKHHKLLVVVTYRDDDLDHAGHLYRVLPYFVRDAGAERVRLQRLDLDATQEIVRRRYDLDEIDRLRLGEYLQNRAGGNPFFTMEVLYALEEQKVVRRVNGMWQVAELDASEAGQTPPDLVRQVIDGRLSRLSEHSRHLLHVAAIIGQNVPIGLWQALSGFDEHAFGASFERIMQANFVLESASGRSVSFRHALVRESIYMSIAFPERQRLHARAGETLSAAPDPVAERVAFHFTRAMDSRAVHWLATAAERALAVCAPYTAIEQCDLALDIADSLATSAPVGVFRTRGNARSMTGEFFEAQKDLANVLQDARGRNDLRDEWQAFQDLGHLWASRDYKTAREYFDRALESARRLQDDSRIAQSLNRVGNLLLNADQPGEAIAFHESALDIFKREGDLLSMAQTTDLLGMNQFILGDLLNAGRMLRYAIDGFSALDERVGLCSALGTYICVMGSSGFEHEIPDRTDAAEAEHLMDTALAIARETGWHAGEAFSLCAIGSYLQVRGSYGAALEALERARSIAEDIDHRVWSSFALCGIADVLISILDSENAQEFAERALRAALAGSSSIHEKGARATLAQIAMAHGDAETALGLLESCCPLHKPPRSSIERFCRMFQAKALIQNGNSDQALDIVDQLVANALPKDQGQVTPVLGRVRAEALLALGRTSDAEPALRAALAAAQQFGYLPEQWRILIHIGNLHASRRRPGDARHSYAAARTIINQLADSLPDATLANHFRTTAQAGIPGQADLSPFQAAKQASGGLTPRQTSVALLVAQGRTNAAIADELSISERTVEGHVSAIMTTLDFSSRAQIAAWAVDQQLARL